MRYNGFIGPTLVCLTNWHFDRSFRFCRAHPCAERTNTKITKLAMYVAIGRIYAIKLCTMSALAACICIGYVGYNKLVHNLAVSPMHFVFRLQCTQRSPSSASYDSMQRACSQLVCRYRVGHVLPHYLVKYWVP